MGCSSSKSPITKNSLEKAAMDQANNQLNQQNLGKVPVALPNTPFDVKNPTALYGPVEPQMPVMEVPVSFKAVLKADMITIFSETNNKQAADFKKSLDQEMLPNQMINVDKAFSVNETNEIKKDARLTVFPAIYVGLSAIATPFDSSQLINTVKRAGIKSRKL